MCLIPGLLALGGGGGGNPSGQTFTPGRHQGGMRHPGATPPTGGPAAPPAPAPQGPFGNPTPGGPQGGMRFDPMFRPAGMVTAGSAPGMGTGRTFPPRNV